MRLVLCGLLLLTGCAVARMVGFDNTKSEMTICGNRWADRNDLTEEATRCCISGSHPVLLRCGGDGTASGRRGNCCDFACR